MGKNFLLLHHHIKEIRIEFYPPLRNAVFLEESHINDKLRNQVKNLFCAEIILTSKLEVLINLWLIYIITEELECFFVN